MRCFRIPVSLLLTIAFTTPILAGTRTELVPAPEIELAVDEAREVEDILADLKRKIKKERPSSARVVFEWFKSAGNEIGVHGDRLTATYAFTGRDVPKAIGEPLEQFGLAFAIITCLEKQFVSGEPAGWDAAYETAKFLAGKVSGGGAAAVGILKYSLDTFANAAMAQIDSDFYRAYCNWQLQERPDWNFYFDLYRQPGGAGKVEAALDRFWPLSPEVAGLRGYGALIHKYKDDLDIARLEQDVAAMDGLVQQIEAGVDAATEACRRFEVQLDAQEKRRFARELPAAKLPSILSDVEQMKLLLDALKKNAVAEKTRQAAATVKKPHEQRKKNAA